jgi:hypothetical protein
VRFPTFSSGVSNEPRISSSDASFFGLSDDCTGLPAPRPSVSANHSWRNACDALGLRAGSNLSISFISDNADGDAFGINAAKPVGGVDENLIPILFANLIPSGQLCCVGAPKTPKIL